MSFHHFSLSFTVFTPPLRQVSSTSYHLQYLNLSQGYSFLPFLSISYPNLNQGLFDEKLHQVSTMAQIYPNINQGHFTKYLSIGSPWPLHNHHSMATRWGYLRSGHANGRLRRGEAPRGLRFHRGARGGLRGDGPGGHQGTLRTWRAHHGCVPWRALGGFGGPGDDGNLWIL